MRRVDIVFTAALLAIAVAALWISTGWVARSSLFVQVIAVPLVALLAVQLVIALRGLRRPEPGDERKGMDLVLGEGLSQRVVWRRGAVFAAWLLGFFVSIWMLGFMVGGLAMMALYMRFGAGERLVPTVAMVIGTGAALTALRAVFTLPLPEGALLRALAG